MNLCDTLIHVRDELPTPQRAALEEELRTLDGVIAPRFTPGRNHLLLVAFNSERVSARSLLDRVQACGYDARLVGL